MSYLYGDNWDEMNEDYIDYLSDEEETLLEFMYLEDWEEEDYENYGCEKDYGYPVYNDRDYGYPPYSDFDDFDNHEKDF